MLPDSTEEYRITLGDCIPTLNAMPDQCIDMSVFSPPFPTLYAYTSLSEDIGNTEGNDEMKIHLSYFYRQLARVIKPGRVCVVHVMQIPRMKRSGGQGLFDFRGLNIRLAERAGLIFEYDWAVRRNPQAAAIVTKSRELQFAGLESDRARSRGALPDYLLKFTAPGENKVPVLSKGDVSRNDWIEWAECTWDAEKYTINADRKKSLTLNTDEGKGEDDTKHICPIQLSIVDRLVRLFTNPGEIVLDPFCGIGSTGFVARKLRRKFCGIELKPEYHATALRNLERAIKMRDAEKCPLFAGFEDGSA